MRKTRSRSRSSSEPPLSKSVVYVVDAALRGGMGTDLIVRTAQIDPHDGILTLKWPSHGKGFNGAHCHLRQDSALHFPLYTYSWTGLITILNV